MKAITTDEILRQALISLVCAVIVAQVLRRAPIIKGLTVYE